MRWIARWPANSFSKNLVFEPCTGPKCAASVMLSTISCGCTSILPRSSNVQCVQVGSFHSCRNGASHSGSPPSVRSEEHTSELQSLMRISYAVFCLKKKKKTKTSKAQALLTHRNSNDSIARNKPDTM